MRKEKEISQLLLSFLTEEVELVLIGKKDDVSLPPIRDWARRILASLPKKKKPRLEVELIPLIENWGVQTHEFQNTPSRERVELDGVVTSEASRRAMLTVELSLIRSRLPDKAKELARRMASEENWLQMSPMERRERVAEELAVLRYEADRFARTTVMQLANAGMADRYFSSGVNYVKYDVVMDPRTSLICRPLSGIVVPLQDAPLPPFHPHCRTIVRPVSDNEVWGGDETANLVDPKRVLQVLPYRWKTPRGVVKDVGVGGGGVGTLITRGEVKEFEPPPSHSPENVLAAARKLSEKMERSYARGDEKIVNRWRALKEFSRRLALPEERRWDGRARVRVWGNIGEKDLRDLNEALRDVLKAFHTIMGDMVSAEPFLRTIEVTIHERSMVAGMADRDAKVITIRKDLAMSILESWREWKKWRGDFELDSIQILFGGREGRGATMGAPVFLHELGHWITYSMGGGQGLGKSEAQGWFWLLGRDQTPRVRIFGWDRMQSSASRPYIYGGTLYAFSGHTELVSNWLERVARSGCDRSDNNRYNPFKNSSYTSFVAQALAGHLPVGPPSEGSLVYLAIKLAGETGRMGELERGRYLTEEKLLEALNEIAGPEGTARFLKIMGKMSRIENIPDEWTEFHDN